MIGGSMFKQAKLIVFLLVISASISSAQFTVRPASSPKPKTTPTPTPAPTVVAKSVNLIPTVAATPTVTPVSQRQRTAAQPKPFAAPPPPEFLDGAVCQGPYLVNYYLSGVGIEDQGIKLLQANFKAHRPGAEISRIDTERNSNLRVSVRVDDVLLEQWQEQSTGRIVVDRIGRPILRQIPWSRGKDVINRSIDIYQETRDDMPTINYITVSAHAKFGIREAHESIVIGTRENYTRYSHDLGRRLVNVISIGDLVEGMGKTKRTPLGIVPYYQLRMVLAEIVFERVMFPHDFYKNPFKLTSPGPWLDHKMNYAESKLYRMVYEKGYKDFDTDRADQKNIIPRVKVAEEPQCKPKGPVPARTLASR